MENRLGRRWAGIATGLSYHPLPNRQNAICNRPSGAKQDYAATLQGVASGPTKTAAPSPASPPAGAATGRRVALVIGNGAYTHVKALPNPSNDARAVAKSLRGIGFVVTEGIDLDRSGMQNVIREFLRDAARSQVAIVSYAGHGVQIDGRNYLVPIDAQLKPGGSSPTPCWTWTPSWPGTTTSCAPTS